jgi:hypothetical protein
MMLDQYRAGKTNGDTTEEAGKSNGLVEVSRSGAQISVRLVPAAPRSTGQQGRKAGPRRAPA